MEAGCWGRRGWAGDLWVKGQQPEGMERTGGRPWVGCRNTWGKHLGRKFGEGAPEEQGPLAGASGKSGGRERGLGAFGRVGTEALGGAGGKMGRGQGPGEPGAAGRFQAVGQALLFLSASGHEVPRRTRVLGSQGCGSPTGQSQAPGGERRSLDPAQRHPGSGRTRSPRRAGGRRPARWREGPSPPAAGLRPRSRRGSVPGALLRRRRLQHEPRARERQRFAAGRAGAQAGRRREGLARAGGAGAGLPGSAVPAPRSLRPALRWGGQSGSSFCRRAGSLALWCLQSDEIRRAGPCQTPPSSRASTWPRHACPPHSHLAQQEEPEKGPAGHLHPGLLPRGLPAAYQGKPVGRYRQSADICVHICYDMLLFSR